MRHTHHLTSDTLAEAAALTAYAIDTPTEPTLSSIQSDLDDPFLTQVFLAVAEHVCELRGRRLATDAATLGA